MNSPVLRINATDIDEGLNGLVHYEVVSGNFNKTFLFEDDGMVFLKKSLLQSQVRGVPRFHLINDQISSWRFLWRRNRERVF